jgi:hypothetical protein
MYFFLIFVVIAISVWIDTRADNKRKKQNELHNAAIDKRLKEFDQQPEEYKDGREWWNLIHQLRG